ncbi:hypothetical protein GW12_07770 [Acinetobacter sp. HR7]|nr:hypothetical protein GW12_07770 [Acinetobacter sp. HR7]
MTVHAASWQRFKNRDVMSCILKNSGGSQSGHATTNNCDIQTDHPSLKINF